MPNDRKANHGEWLDITASVERGHVPAAQMGKVELTGSASDWAGNKRYEPFVFVICGRNVQPGRFQTLLRVPCLPEGAGLGRGGGG